MARKITYYGAKSIHSQDDIIVCAWDLETKGLGGAALMAQWEAFDGPKYATGPGLLDKLMEGILECPYPCVWFAHFSQYDWRYLMDYFIEKEWDIDIGMRTETDIYEIRFKVEGNKYVMRDSFAIYPHPLADLARRFAPEFPKLEIDIENFNPDDAKHIEYACRDVTILRVALPRYFDLIEKHYKVTPSATVAGTALKAWQMHIGEKKYYASKYDEQEKFTRQAYYGGLVFLTDTNIIENAETFDLNSSYPFSMCEYGVPYGRAVISKDYENEAMGIYRVRVKAPNDLIVPILPTRDNKGNMRWCRGEFETCVTNRELVFAAQNGYEILKIHEGIVFEEVLFPFQEFINKCKALRVEYKGSAEEFVAKLMQNSLYGKFGSRRERLKLMAAWAMDDGDLIGATPFDDEGNWYVNKEIDEDMRCMPHWAAFITAHSRLRLLQSVYTVGPENAIYGDTDSITIRSGYGHLLDVGNDYGQWKLEKQWRQFKAIAPKVYTGILDSGEYKGAAKGLPRKGMTEKNWMELLEGKTTFVGVQSLASLKTSMKKGVKPATQLTRRSTDLANSRNFELLPSGKVLARIAA